jgi:hypothetical protein
MFNVGRDLSFRYRLKGVSLGYGVIIFLENIIDPMAIMPMMIIFYHIDG